MTGLPRGRVAMTALLAAVVMAGALLASDALRTSGFIRPPAAAWMRVPAALSASTRVEPEIPERIAIPALSVSALVVAVGKDATGGVAVPEDISTVGWYSASERLGSPLGTTVIVGHRDGRDVGAGAFYELEKLSSGDRVLVAGDGAATSFTVREVLLVPKEDFAQVSPQVFSSKGTGRVVLVSCGGEFDYSLGSYESNVIVIAYPTPAN